MTPERPRGFCDARDNGNVDKIMSHFADDRVYQASVDPEPATTRKDVFRKIYQ